MMEPTDEKASRSKFFIELIGWVGVGLILLAYSLVSFRIFDGSSGLYQIMNLIGSLGIVVSSLSKKDNQPAALNIIWALIAVIALLNTRR